MKTLCALSCFAVALFACQPPLDGGEEPALDADEVPEQYRESALTAVKVRIQAEDYLPGGEGVGYHDNTAGNTGGSYRQDDVDLQPTGDVGGGFNVGWVGDGEYLVYALNVPSPGRVTLTARVASARTELKRVHAEVDGRALPAVSFSDSAGWQVYRDLPLGSLDLDSGKHTLRIVADVGSGSTIDLERDRLTARRSKMRLDRNAVAIDAGGHFTARRQKNRRSEAKPR